MSSAADPASRPRVRHTLISELFFSLLDMGTKGLLGSKLKPVRSSWPYENGSWIILDHQGEAVRLSEDVLTKEFHGLLIHLGLGSPNSRFRHGAPALHCSLQGRQTPGIAQASPTLAHPLDPWSRSLGCTSEAYLQQISSLAFSRAGPRHHNGGIPACALFTWLDTPHAAAAALLITSPLQGNSSLCLGHLYGAVAEQRPLSDWGCDPPNDDEARDNGWDWNVLKTSTALFVWLLYLFVAWVALGWVYNF